MSASNAEHQTKNRGPVSPEELRRSLLQQKAILDNIPDIAWLKDRESRFITVNGPFGEACGVAPVDLIGKTDYDIWPRDLAESYRADDAEVMRTGSRKRVEERLVGPDRQERWIETIKTPIIDDRGNVIGTTGIARDITERKKADEALLESEEQFRTVFDSASDGILLVDTQTRQFVMGNTAIANMLGIAQEDLPTLRVEDIHPADALQDVLQGFERAVRGETRLSEHIPVLRRDGTVLLADIATSWIRLRDKTYMAGFFRDRTEQRKMEEALRESERKYRALFDSATDAIFILDLKGNVLNANRTAYTRLGYTKQEMLSMHVSQIDSPESSTTVSERIAQISGSGRAVFEAYHMRKDGSSMPVEVNALLTDYEGQPALFSIVRDLSERKKAEQERLELERRLLHAQKLESLGILAGGIAHDFNNLLMAIMGNLDLALMSITPGSPAVENIERSTQAARRATDLTRQMLAYSGRGSFIVKAMDLNEMVEENSRLFKAAVSATTTLRLQLAKEVPRFNADAGQIQQVIMNLLTNASEAIGEKPGVITLTTGVMHCDAGYLRQSRTDEIPPPGTFVFLEVSDTGMGMDNETLHQLFDPFFTKKKAGRGLGMSAILGIVRGHHGAVLVDSAPGKGATIRILFPARAEAQALTEAPAAEAAAQAGISVPRSTILVVDDEKAVRAVCEEMIAHLGARVLAARDGREAISVFETHAPDIDLVILDLSMPVMDGITTLPELLRIKPDVKVILSSGFDREDALKVFSGKGITEFIQKPYSFDKLRSALHHALTPEAQHRMDSVG